ncbi:hypothetical protein J3Q64DRAFT_1703417 [Phycomyces blakesleeanus]|uniref:Uncharacterized protein n=1 Tax=Phycomyces blakesleeanus TaxID=4837 RepID=A0ABR3ALK9_PHYBL
MISYSHLITRSRFWLGFLRTFFWVRYLVPITNILLSPKFIFLIFGLATVKASIQAIEWMSELIGLLYDPVPKIHKVTVNILAHIRDYQVHVLWRVTKRLRL